MSHFFVLTLISVGFPIAMLCGLFALSLEEGRGLWRVRKSQGLSRSTLSGTRQSTGKIGDGKANGKYSGLETTFSPTPMISTYLRWDLMTTVLSSILYHSGQVNLDPMCVWPSLGSQIISLMVSSPIFQQISSLLFRRVNLSYFLGILVLGRPWYLQSQVVTEHSSLHASPLFLHGVARSHPSCLHISPSFLLSGKSLIFLWGLTVYDCLF